MAKFSLYDFLSFLNRHVRSSTVPFDEKRQKLHILYAAFACAGDFHSALIHRDWNLNQQTDALKTR